MIEEIREKKGREPRTGGPQADSPQVLKLFHNSWNSHKRAPLGSEF